MSCQDYEARLAITSMATWTRPSGRRSSRTCRRARRAGHSSTDFSVIRAASLTLEAQVPPPHVWRKLSAAIEAEPKPFFGLGGAYWWRALAPVAAMVVLVVALSWTAGRLTPVADRAAGRRRRRRRTRGSEPVSIVAEYQLAEQNLTNTIVGLERIAADDRSTLDMETADVLKANLTVLDGAIGESRDALQKEPENDVAQQSLFEALRQQDRAPAGHHRAHQRDAERQSGRRRPHRVRTESMRPIYGQACGAFAVIDARGGTGRGAGLGRRSRGRHRAAGRGHRERRRARGRHHARISRIAAPDRAPRQDRAGGQVHVVLAQAGRQAGEAARRASQRHARPSAAGARKSAAVPSTPSRSRKRFVSARTAPSTSRT